MVTVKKDTIKANVFEKKIITLIKLVKGMDIQENIKKILLEELRNIHNSCLEWEEPKTDFEIPEYLTIKEGNTYSAKQTVNVDTALQIAWETLPEEYYQKLKERIMEL